MKLLELLRTTPRSRNHFLAFVSILTIVSIFILAGSFGVSRGLASGSWGLPFGNLNSFEQSGDLDQQLNGDSGLIQTASVPEGILTPWDGQSRVTVLVMGLDYRDWTAADGPPRSDTMMLLTLDPLSNTAGILSIPRDLWVSIPGFDNGRINTAYFLGEVYQMPGGGPGLAVMTVEQLLGVEINYFAQIDFGAFVRFIDELKGVKIDIPHRIKVTPLHGDVVILKPGRQALTGELALAYARQRYTAGGDFDRALRQQQVIMGVRDRLLNPDSLASFIGKAPALYQEISSGVHTNMTLEQLVKLALLAQKVPTENINQEVISVNEVVFADSPDGQSILLPLPEKIREIRDEVFLMNTGSLGPLLPGSTQERMAAEGAKVVLLNASLVEGLALETQLLLQSLGANVVEISNGEYSDQTKIIDYTGNPHTVQYLAELFGVLPGNYELIYDPNSPVDVVVTLGVDWSQK